MPTKIMTCSCKNEFQDKRYGKNRRVHNEASGGKYRCSACAKER